MADISDYSTLQQKVIREIIENDRGFHSSYLTADMPFFGMLDETDNGQTIVKSDIIAPLSTDGADYNLRLYYSTEQKCWFYLFSYLGEEIRGIVHYNTLFNSMGELSFAILNDNVNDTDLSVSLPYSNILVLRT